MNREAQKVIMFGIHYGCNNPVRIVDHLAANLIHTHRTPQ